MLVTGRRADFTVLGSDPTQNIAAAEDIVEVWESGRIIPGPLQKK